MIRVDTKMIEDVKAKLLDTSGFRGIKTGFDIIDSFSGGFANGELIILGARPAMGKTTFASSLIDNVCINGGKSCAFFTTDMSVRQTVERLIRLHGNIKSSEKDGVEFFNRIERTTSDLEKTRLWINETTVGAGDEFIESCRAIGKEERIDLIIIDHLQSFESESKDLTGILKSLQQLAVELDCPVLLLSQLRRTCEKRRGHMPQIADIPNGKIVERYASEVLLLYRPAYYDIKANPNLAHIEFAKHDKFQRCGTYIYYNPAIPAFRSNPLNQSEEEKMK